MNSVSFDVFALYKQKQKLQFVQCRPVLGRTLHVESYSQPCQHKLHFLAMPNLT